jgi:hypothetical protein
MVSLQQAQTGKRVYNGLSQAPNRGRVSANGAQGYIQREMRNAQNAGPLRQQGNDGFSDSRSTTAAQALRRRNQDGKAKGAGPYNNTGRPQAGPYNGDKQPPFTPPGPPGQGAGPGHSAQPPQITISADGVLQLPYDQSYATEQLSAITEANDKLLGLKSEADQNNLAYTQNKRNADLANQSLQSQTLNQNAASGTAFSSQYGTAVANNARAYAGEIGDIEAQQGSFNNNLGLQRQAIQSSLNQQLAMLAQGYAHDLNEQAGTLGYGTSRGHTSQPHRPNRNSKPNKPKRHKKGKK